MQERVKAKKRMTVEIDETLASAAAVKGIDLAALLEDALRARLQGSDGKRALSDDDRAAIEVHNQFEAKHGKWTDGLEKL